MKNLLIIISILTIVNITFAQGEFTPPTTYFETTPVYLDLFTPSPSPTNQSGAVTYFDLSPIGSEKPDIAIVQNFQEIVNFPFYNFNKHGSWNENLGIGNFSNQNTSPFFPTESSFGDIAFDNPFNASLFVKLRNDIKKDFVALRKNNLYVFRNQNDILSHQVQNIASGGTYMDAGNFSPGDNSDDVGVVNGGTVRIYNNLLTGFLDINTNILTNVSNVNKFKIRQINDKTFPYPQNNANDKADIITIRNSDQNIYIYQNNNNNTVTLSQQFDAGININDIEVADVNRDGFNDVIVISQGLATVKVFLNNGLGVINSTPVYTSSPPSVFSGLISISDLNNDGYNDIIIVGSEGYTRLYINTNTGSYFSQTPNQSINLLAGLQSTNSQIKVMDIYNQGGKALFISWNGTGPVPNSARGISRVNAVCFNWPPPPPLISASIHKDGTYNRPKIKIISNFETNDFLKYEIYKSNAASGWNFNYCGQTTTNEFIDNTEYVLYTGNGDAPPPNCIYAVKTVDSTNFRSNLSNELGYRVGDPICPTCGVEGMEGSGDNSFVNSTPESESNLFAPTEFSVSNFPNPFNPVTKIYYNLPIPGNVKIEIYNSKGQMIKELVNDFKFEGNYLADFDGSNLSSGVYFYKIETNNFSQTKRMILLK